MTATKIEVPAKTTYPFELPDLPYAHDALEPTIDAKTMEIHHGKHHKAYTDKLNAALEGHEDLQGKGIIELLSDLDSIPEEIRTAVRNNGGGYLNHAIFWHCMTPGGSDPSDEFLAAVERDFGSHDKAHEEFSKAAAGQFGSGWAWMACTPEGKLHIHGMPNQDNPVMHGDTPIFGLDVWEHAYYLKYQNRRPDYIDAWWSVINAKFASEQYAAACS